MNTGPAVPPLGPLLTPHHSGSSGKSCVGVEDVLRPSLRMDALSGPSAKGAGRDRGETRKLPRWDRWPELELALRLSMKGKEQVRTAKEPALQREEPAGPLGDHPCPSQIERVWPDRVRTQGQKVRHRLRADPGDSQKLIPVRRHDLDREPIRMLKSPGHLRIPQERQVPIIVEDQLLEPEAVLLHQMIRLVQPVAPHSGGGAVFLQRGLGDRLEGGEVGMVQGPVLVKITNHLQDLPIPIVGSPHHELGGDSGGG